MSRNRTIYLKTIRAWSGAVSIALRSSISRLYKRAGNFRLGLFAAITLLSSLNLLFLMPAARASLVVHVNLPTFWDLLDNSVTTSVTSPVNELLGISLTHEDMTATFSPNFGYSLNQAARFGKFNHFNWLSVVVADPELALPFAGTLFPGLKNMQGKLPTVPYVDPVFGGYQYELADCEKIGTANSFPVRDSLPWYWDETYSFTCQKASPPSIVPEIRGKEVVPNPYTLKFEDMPSGVAGLPIDFETCLAGVNADGTGVVFGNTNTCFQWSYVGNIVGGSELVVRDNTNPNLVSGGTATFGSFLSTQSLEGAAGDPIRSLGIPIVNLPVPEPSSMALLFPAVPLLVLLRGGRRSTKKGSAITS